MTGILTSMNDLINRLGEILVDSPGKYRQDRHVSRGTLVHYRCIPNGVNYAILHIPWTKTTGQVGAEVVLTQIRGLLDPVTAIKHHQTINTAAPKTAPFFSYDTDGGWTILTKDRFLARCNEVWAQGGHETMSGHCFRIGGATELLLRGTHPDVVAAIGSWKSKAFLEYWRKIEKIIPLFVSQASDMGRIQLMKQSMDSFKRRHT